MTVIAELIRDTDTILLVDWPDRDVPDTLARSGYTVFSHDGPAESDYNAYELEDGGVRVRPAGRPPERVDLVYTHRPIDELPEIVDQARGLGARAVWIQSGLDATGAKDARGTWLPDSESAKARAIVEAAGLTYVDGPYIGDAVRAVSGGGSQGEEA